jgi:hypothetical protein
LSAPTKLVSPERQEAACDADRQVHVGWRKIHVGSGYTGQGSYLGMLHLHVRAECEVGGEMSGVAEVDVKDCMGDGHAGLAWYSMRTCVKVQYNTVSHRMEVGEPIQSLHRSARVRNNEWETSRRRVLVELGYAMLWLCGFLSLLPPCNSLTTGGPQLPSHASGCTFGKSFTFALLPRGHARGHRVPNSRCDFHSQSSSCLRHLMRSLKLAPDS